MTSDSPEARALAAAGAEVVAADLADPASVVRAFAVHTARICVTFFWNHFSPDQGAGRSAMRWPTPRSRHACEHVIWSTLEDSRRWVKLDDPRMPTLMGNYKVPHFDVKGEADDVLPCDRRAHDVPVDLVLLGQPDPLRHGARRPGPDGKLRFALPMGDRPLPGIAADDIGRCAHGIFKRGNEFAGRTVGIAGEHLTGAQMAAGLTLALGREVLHQDVPFDVFRGLGFPGAEDLGNMFQFNHDFSADFCAARSIEFSRSVNPGLQSFSDWLAAHGREIPLT